MNYKAIYAGLTLFLCLFHIESFCQIDPETKEHSDGNIFCKNKTHYEKDVTLTKNKAIAADSNMFWGVNNHGMVIQYAIKDTTIASIGIIDTSIPGLSLAVCNNLNGGSLNPTFYTNLINYLFYYDGDTNWIKVPQTAQYTMFNSGGYGNLLYCQNDGFNNLQGKIIGYDGSSFSTLYTYDSLYFSVADIAVDCNRNIVCCVSPDKKSCQFIDIISPAGQLIKRYNTYLSSNNIYGCFIVKNTLYLGCGASHPAYPYSLLPITFIKDSAYIGTPYNMPKDTLCDLASLHSGSPLYISNSTHALISDFKLILNTAFNTIVIYFTSSLPFSSNNHTISIYTIQGKLTQKQLLTQKKTILNIHSLANGVYILNLKSDTRVENVKFVKR